MKKIITLAVLTGSLILVGCNNSKERSVMEKIFDKIDGPFIVNKCVDSPLVPSNPDLSNLKNNKFNPECYLNLEEFSVVDESAEGDDRVVIKRWIEGNELQMPCWDLLDYSDFVDSKANKNECRCLVNTNADEILAQVEANESKTVNKTPCFQTIHQEGHWEYWGVEFPEEFDLDKLAQNGEVENFVRDVFGWSFNHFGQLKYEPADNEFFYHDGHNGGGHVLFSETVGSLKDLELMGAKVEENNAAELGKKLAAQYGLSEERGLEVGKIISVYNKLTSKRALTPREMDKFTDKLLGVNYKEAERGIRSGDQNDFDTLMEKAAETNGTSPEAVSAIIKDMVL